MAILMKKYDAEGAKTNAQQERDARADPDYLELLTGLRIATEESERLRWELKLAEIAVDIWRTKQASKRAERSGYGA